jgi:hypothetical protein
LRCWTCHDTLSVFILSSFYWSVSTTSLWASQRKNIATNGDLLLEPFKNKINNMFIYNSKKYTSSEHYPKYLISDKCFFSNNKKLYSFLKKIHNNAKFGSQKNRWWYFCIQLPSHSSSWSPVHMAQVHHLILVMKVNM